MAQPLKKTQNLLWKLIAWPEGVADALSHSSNRSLPIADKGKLSAAQRLDIYANMYFYRILDGLKEDFPSIPKLIGDKEFHNLVTRYLEKHPSTHYSLRYAGSKMEKFLAGDSTAKKWPYLRELAKVELALMKAFDAKDSGALVLADLLKIPPVQWAGLKFTFSPSIEILSFDWNAGELRAELIKKKASIKPVREKNKIRFWRKDFTVLYRTVPNLEHAILQSLLKGDSFEEACAVAARKVGVAQAPMAVAQNLQTWIEEGLVSGVTV